MTIPQCYRWFTENSQHLDGLKRATYAYNMSHGEPTAHYFTGSARDSQCRWCGHSREAVRWNWHNTPPECSRRPKRADESVEGVIALEEALFEKVIERANKLAATIDGTTLSGEELAILHHTHGVDPSMLEVALMAAGKEPPTQEAHDVYQKNMEIERKRSKAAHKQEIVSVKPSALLSKKLE